MTDKFEFSFLAGLHRFDAAAKKASFYIMNTSMNRNRWGVTEKALAEASPSLKGKKLGMGKDYRIDKHYPAGETMDVGAFVASDNHGAYLLGDAAIEDPQTVNLLKSGKLGPVSVVIHAYDVRCSECGEELKAADSGKEHKCFKKAGGAYEQVHSFVFNRVDFVDVPAFPQAGLLELASNAEAKGVPIELLAGFYESEISQSPKFKGVHEVSENKEFEVKIAALEQSNKQLEADLKKAKIDAETNAGKVTELSAKLKQIEDEKHAGLVEQAYKVRVEACIAGEEKAERDMLAKQSDDILKMFISDAQKVAVKLQAQGPPSPKTKYTAQDVTSLDAKIKERRASLGIAELKSEQEKS